MAVARSGGGGGGGGAGGARSCRLGGLGCREVLTELHNLDLHRSDRGGVGSGDRAARVLDAGRVEVSPRGGVGGVGDLQLEADVVRAFGHEGLHRRIECRRRGRRCRRLRRGSRCIAVVGAAVAGSWTVEAVLLASLPQAARPIVSATRVTMARRFIAPLAGA